jgi:hypothetical protein
VWLPAVLIPVVLLSAGALGLWRLAGMAPAWWSPPDPEDEQTTQLAERVEYRLAEEAHKVRAEPAPWWIEIRQDQINAWLAARLPEWVAHTHGIRWPAGVGLPQVSLDSGTVRVGLDLETETGPRYLVAHLAPAIVDGELALALEGMSVGRLWLPGSSVGAIMDRLRHTEAGRFLDDPALEPVLEILDGGRRIDPTLTLSDGRRVRVLDIQCRSDALLLRAQTIAQE